MNTRILLLILFFITSFSCIAEQSQQQSDKAVFKQAYKQYKSAIADRDLLKAEIFAEQSLELGKAIYSEKSIEIANLSMNYVQMFLLNQKGTVEDKQIKSKVLGLYELIIKNTETKYGKNSLELIDPYMGLGDVYNNKFKKYKKGLKYYQKALKIAKSKKETSALLYADLLLEVGRKIAIYSDKQKLTMRYIENAYDIYHEHLESNDKRVADSAFWLGKLKLIDKKYRQSEKFFLEVMDIYEQADRLADESALTTSAFLVKVYEKMGKRDKANQYCRLIGEAKPWDENRDQMPVYILEPRWPRSALINGQEGMVKIGFTIDKNGFVKEPEIKDYSGSSKFKKAAIDAVEKWRFAPKYENGNPVDAVSTYTMEFKLAK